LTAQCERYETVLDKLSQGVCVFGGDKRLVLANRRFAEIYSLRPEDIPPGTSLRAIIERRAAAGAYTRLNSEQHIAYTDRINQVGQSRTRIAELANGRVVFIYHQPMPGGGWIATHEDITDRRRSQAQIEHMAHHDALTDLPNRVLFLQRLAQAVRRAHASDKMSAILYLDLDHFKEVNDTLGHAIGDRMLQEVSARLKPLVGRDDIFARLGGDEFAIILSDIGGAEAAVLLAKRIIAVFERPFDLEGHEVVVGVSIGIALCQPGLEASEPERLLRNADMALYRAKGDGRGTYRFFEAEMDEHLQARKALEQDMRRALADDQFEVHYQPKVDAIGQIVTGVEALVRWRHPVRGLVPPAAFIPLAEETGLILQIGERVQRKACARAAMWRPLMLAVNLSPIQLRQAGFAELVARILRETAFEPARLELEITESTLLQEPEVVIAALTALKQLGVRIAMDDFGTGYSSLSYLRRFPFDRLKIDRSFIHDIDNEAKLGAIVKAAIAMGHALGIETTAEGVETREQADVLHRHGCDEMQGFYFGRPMPGDDFERLLCGAVEGV
jgi:diguanylate cyclase (GGDEF)-like protein